MRCENLFERCEVLKNGVGKFCSVAKRRGAKWENDGVARSAKRRGGKSWSGAKC